MEKEPINFTILVIENNPDHARLIEEQIQQRSSAGFLSHQVVTLRDGLEALSYLKTASQAQKSLRPNLIILNLDLPDRNGREVLVEIKSDPHLKRIPIVVLTASSDPTDVAQSYEAYGNSYVIKASEEEELLQTIKKIETFWLEIVTLPLE